jgi:DNA-3-methyladenine glycosylase I
MSVTAQGVVQGPDGKSRCWWATGGAPEYIAYHDQVWGRPMRDETKLFETLTLESFQSGLSWITILRKQENFRSAFDGWELERVASYGQADFDRLMADASIVRNGPRSRRRSPTRRPCKPCTPTARPSPTCSGRSHRSFVFIGPTTAYSLMQGAGLVNDHLAGCDFR